MSVLQVPVDHRLRKIIRKLQERNEALDTSGVSDHEKHLINLSETLRDREWCLSDKEVDFACYLARPATPGGIVVALTQPTKSQDYHIAQECVIEKCPTLRALKELSEFFNLSFDSLSIFDAFPFIVEKYPSDTNIDHRDSHITFHRMVLKKRPAVILTAWKPPYQKFEEYSTRYLRKKNIGEQFPSPTIDYHGMPVSLVNSPHPSYYMNHNPTESCFRQLQILEFAQACGRLHGTWKEERWMADLRKTCKERTKVLGEDGRNHAEDQDFLTERLEQTLEQLKPVLVCMGWNLSSKANIEAELSKKNLLQLCADVSLILLQVSSRVTAPCYGTGCCEAMGTFFVGFHDARWPDLKSSLASESETHGIYAHDCFLEIPDLSTARLSNSIETHLRTFAIELNTTWTNSEDDFEADFEAQASAFFRLAENIEDAMDRIPDNTRIWGKIANQVVQVPEMVNPTNDDDIQQELTKDLGSLKIGE